MEGNYTAVDARDDDIGGPMTWPIAALISDSGVASPRSPKNATVAKKRSPRRLLNLARLASLPMILHMTILGIYLCLCVIWMLGLEEKIIVPFSHASRTRTWINVVSHITMMILSTTIVAVMQPIATRSPFVDLPQPLTRLSDNISSWNGLGSSLVNLYHNLRFRAALGSAIITASYFGALTGLVSSSSYIFDIPPYNTTTNGSTTTRVGTPSVRGFIPPDSGISGVPTDFTNLTFDWYRSGMGVGMLNSDNATVYPGLSANRIYDTLLLPMSTALNTSARVNYTDFNVKCGSVPKASISATSPTSYNNAVGSYGTTGTSASDSRRFITLSVNYTLGSSRMSLRDSLSVSDSDPSRAVSRLWQPADILLRVPDSNVVPGLGRNLVLYNIYDHKGHVSGSQPILDSDNSTGSPWPFAVKELPLNSSLMVQVIGCSLSTTEGSTAIDVANNQLLNSTSSLQGASARSTWAEWQPDLGKSNLLEDAWASMFLPNVGSIGLWDSQPVPPTDVWSCFSYQSNPSGAASGPNSSPSVGASSTESPDPSVPPPMWTGDQLKSMYVSCHVPTVIEDYLTTRLFGGVTAHDGTGDAMRDSFSANATLGALESALARATAMTMWSAARASTLTVTCPQTSLTQGRNEEIATGQFVLPPSTVFTPVNGSTYVSAQFLVGRLAFNVPFLLLGTSLAVLIAALGTYMLIQDDAVRVKDAPIGDVGLLGIMTLNNSAVAARLAPYRIAGSLTRRRAGAFLVEIVDDRLVPVQEGVCPP